MSKLISAFRGLSAVKRAAVVAVTAWNLSLIVAAQRDLSRRTSDEIRGSKWIWRLVCLTNTVGPLVYFRWGRRPRA